MKSRRTYFYGLIAPLMIAVSILGLCLRVEKKKIQYLPVGIIGIYIIVQKELNRSINRKNILGKIKLFQKDK